MIRNGMTACRAASYKSVYDVYPPVYAREKGYERSAGLGLRERGGAKQLARIVLAGSEARSSTNSICKDERGDSYFTLTCIK